MMRRANGDRMKWAVVEIGSSTLRLLADEAVFVRCFTHSVTDSAIKQSAFTFNDPWAGLVRALCGLPDRQALHDRLAAERVTLYCPDALVGGAR